MEINTSSSKGQIEPNKPAHISIWVQKSRLRMYVNEEKAFDIPKGVFSNYVYNRMRFITTNRITSYNVCYTKLLRPTLQNVPVQHEHQSEVRVEVLHRKTYDANGFYLHIVHRLTSLLRTRL